MIYSVVKNNMQYIKIALIYFLLFYHTQTFSLFLIQQPKLSFSNISQNLVISLLKPLLRFFSYSDSESSPPFPLPTCSGPVLLLWLSSSTLLSPAPITPAFSSVPWGFSLTVSFTRGSSPRSPHCRCLPPFTSLPKYHFSMTTAPENSLHFGRVPSSPTLPIPWHFLFIYLFLFYGCAAWHDQGSNLSPLHCKCGVLTTGSPGKSYLGIFYCISLLTCSSLPQHHLLQDILSSLLVCGLSPSSRTLNSARAEIFALFCLIAGFQHLE